MFTSVVSVFLLCSVSLKFPLFANFNRSMRITNCQKRAALLAPIRFDFTKSKAEYQLKGILVDSFEGARRVCVRGIKKAKHLDCS